jgi:hypothetical protein
MVMNILSALFSQDTGFLSNYWRPDLLLILSIMFAFIAVIVKRETRISLPLIWSGKSLGRVRPTHHEVMARVGTEAPSTDCS